MTTVRSPKTHYTGVPCGCNRRWGSCFISSTGDLSRVTCGNCLRILAGKLVVKMKVFTADDGTTVDRTLEYARPDPEIKVTLPGGYFVRFWEQRLSNEEYIRRAKLIHKEESKR